MPESTRTKTLEQLLAVDRSDISYLIEPRLLSKGGTMAIYGPAGSLKSWLTVDMAFHLTRGDQWVAYPTKVCSVLMVQSELTEAMYAERVQDYCAQLNGSRPDNLYFDNDMTIRLDDFTGFSALEQDVRERKPTVIVLDCLYKMLGGIVSSEQDIGRFIKNVDRIRSKYNVAFILVHHPRKQGRGDSDEEIGFEEMLGSSILYDWLDTIVRVTGVPKNTDQPKVIDLTFQKVRHAKVLMGGLRVRFNSDTLRFDLA